MNTLKLHASLEAEEHAVQKALLEHGLIQAIPHHVRLDGERMKEFSPLLRDVFVLSGNALCKALRKHLDAGEDPDATPASFGVAAFRRCFNDFAANTVETSGDAPGWISRHSAVLQPNGFVVTGGWINPGHRHNEEPFLFYLETLVWQKTGVHR